MFVTDRALDIILKAKDDANIFSLKAIEVSHDIALGALRNEIASLRQATGKLEEQLRYERARADSLVDRLLVRDARVAAVAPAAVAAAVHKDAEGAKVLKEIFDEMNKAGVDFPAPEQRAFDLAGGTAVSPGIHTGGY